MSLEGALGKISVNTTRNPKKAIHVSTPANKIDTSKVAGALSQKAILSSIEAAYSSVLHLEQLKRKTPQGDEETEKWQVS